MRHRKKLSGRQFARLPVEPSLVVGSERLFLGLAHPRRDRILVADAAAVSALLGGLSLAVRCTGAVASLGAADRVVDREAFRRLARATAVAMRLAAALCTQGLEQGPPSSDGSDVVADEDKGAKHKQATVKEAKKDEKKKKKKNVNNGKKKKKKKKKKNERKGKARKESFPVPAPDAASVALSSKEERAINAEADAIFRDLCHTKVRLGVTTVSSSSSSSTTESSATGGVVTAGDLLAFARADVVDGKGKAKGKAKGKKGESKKGKKGEGKKGKGKGKGKVETNVVAAVSAALDTFALLRRVSAPLPPRLLSSASCSSASSPSTLSSASVYSAQAAGGGHGASSASSTTSSGSSSGPHLARRLGPTVAHGHGQTGTGSWSMSFSSFASYVSENGTRTPGGGPTKAKASDRQPAAPHRTWSAYGSVDPRARGFRRAYYGTTLALLDTEGRTRSRLGWLLEKCAVVVLVLEFLRTPFVSL